MPHKIVSLLLFLLHLFLSLSAAIRPLPQSSYTISTDLSPTLPSHGISAVLAFGDSTLDSGNNNFLRTIVRADRSPYGQDFPGGVATGRFSNGKLITDFLVSSLGLKQTLPASSDPNLTTADLLTGVSFASAGSGLDNLTAGAVGVVTMAKQVENFEEYVEKLREAVGRAKGDEIVKDALFVIGAGSNDFMMNYYMLPVRRLRFSLIGYQLFLQQRMELLVRKLYKMGGRKFTIAGLPPLGCLPFVKSVTAAGNGLRGQYDCIEQRNVEAVSYNDNLQKLIQDMQSSLKGAKFAYVDIYNPFMDMIRVPAKYGFTEVNHGCCIKGVLEIVPFCLFPSACSDPSKFLFWDAVHPSQATYQVLAGQMMKDVLPKITN